MADEALQQQAEPVVDLAAMDGVDVQDLAKARKERKPRKPKAAKAKPESNGQAAEAAELPELSAERPWWDLQVHGSRRAPVSVWTDKELQGTHDDLEIATAVLAQEARRMAGAGDGKRAAQLQRVAVAMLARVEALSGAIECRKAGVVRKGRREEKRRA